MILCLITYSSFLKYCAATLYILAFIVNQSQEMWQLVIAHQKVILKKVEMVIFRLEMLQQADYL